MVAIIDTHINTVVTFHDVLHGFCTSRVVGTAIMEINTRKELVIIDQDLLFLVLLDLWKSYEALDHGRILHTIEGYGVEPNMQGILKEFWGNREVVTR